MVSKESLGTFAEVALVILLLGPLAGHLLGQPIVLGYVETGSMSPTLDPGDGFIAVPKPIAGSIDEGDIVVYRAENIHQGGLVTHRVVGRTDSGAYITKGDANPIADQQAEEPPVAESQIVATALQVGGNAVVVPAVGSVVSTVRVTLLRVRIWLKQLFGISATFGPGTTLFVLSVALGLLYIRASVAENTGKSRRKQSRRRRRYTGLDTRFVLAVLVLVLVASMTATMVLPSGTKHLESDTEETLTGNYSIQNGGIAPVVVFLDEGDRNVTVADETVRVEGLQTETERVTVAPDPREREYALTERRYLAVLPTGTLRSLHDIDPLLPVLVIDALVALPLYLLGVRLVGTGRLRTRSRSRSRL